MTGILGLTTGRDNSLLRLNGGKTSVADPVKPPEGQNCMYCGEPAVVPSMCRDCLRFVSKYGTNG